MHHTLIGLAALSLYMATTALLSQQLVKGTGAGSVQLRLATLFAVAGTGLHGLLLHQTVFLVSGLNFGFFNALSIVSWLIILILLLSMLFQPRENLGIVVYPLGILCLALSMAFYSEQQVLSGYAPGLTAHIALAILAYSLLTIAALQALLLAYQDHQLRTRHPGRIMGAMPPLQTMEKLLFKIMGLGVLMLTLAILSGMVFLDDMFAQHVAHKTILSIAAWLIFATLLWGRWRYGWRGRLAIRWSLAGFVILMLAFLGTKVVFEFIIGR